MKFLTRGCFVMIVLLLSFYKVAIAYSPLTEDDLGALEYSYIGYLAAFSDEEGQNMESVFIFRPASESTEFSYGYAGSDNTNDDILKLARDRCGEGCFVFAVNRKVTLDKFGYTDYFNKLLEEISFNSDMRINYFDPNLHSISAFQRKGLKHQAEYAQSFSGFRHRAFAISLDGNFYGEMDADYEVERIDLERLALHMCRARSYGQTCVAYSYNDHIYGQ